MEVNKVDRILFIAPFFYNYEIDIFNELNEADLSCEDLERTKLYFSNLDKKTESNRKSFNKNTLGYISLDLINLAKDWVANKPDIELAEILQYIDTVSDNSRKSSKSKPGATVQPTKE